MICCQQIADREVDTTQRCSGWKWFVWRMQQTCICSGSKFFLVPEKIRTRDNHVKMVKQMFQLTFAIKYTKSELFAIPKSYGQWFGLDLKWNMFCQPNKISRASDGIRNGSNVTFRSLGSTRPKLQLGTKKCPESVPGVSGTPF